MADGNPTDRELNDPAGPGNQDEIMERSVLTDVLLLHPEQLTILELALRMDAGCEDFAKKDAIERAIRELTRDGLLHCDCRRVWPSRAAVRFEQLIGG